MADDNETQDAAPAAPAVLQPVQAGPTNWGSLPPELQADILRRVVDPKDLNGSLNDVASLLQTSRTLNSIVRGEIDKEKLKGIRQNVWENTGPIEDIPLGNRSLGRGTSAKALKLAALTADADFLSLKTSTERRDIVNGVLGSREFPRNAVKNLVRNIEYASAEDRSRIVDYVCDRGESKYAMRMLPELIEKADILKQSQLSRLVETSCDLGEDETVEKRRARLDSWAGGKMKLLSDQQQSQILNVITADEPGKGGSLAYFAEHLNDLSEKNRSEVAKEILALPAETEGKWAGLSYLAEHLPSLNELDKSTVASYIVNTYRNVPVEDIGDEQKWHSKPDFCRVEAIHQLSKHDALLNRSECASVETFIKEIVTRDGQDAEQAQLLPHMPDEKRGDFVGEALQGNTAGVVYGLTARLQDMNKAEKEEYVSHLDDHNQLMTSQEHYEAVDYNICNNLEHFTPNQRSTLVDRRLEVVRDDDIMEAGPAFADIARNAKHLRIEDVITTIERASDVVNNCIEDMPTDARRIASIRSAAGSAAQCLANWGGEAVYNARAMRGNPAPADQQADLAADSDMTDDESNGEAFRSPQRRDGRDSRGGSAHSDTDSSDDDGPGAGGASRSISRGHLSPSVDEVSDSENDAQFLYSQRSTRPQGKTADDAITVPDSDDEVMTEPSAGPSTSRRASKRSRDDLEAYDSSPSTSTATAVPEAKRARLDERGDRSRSGSREL